MESLRKPSRSEELCSDEQAMENQQNVKSQFEASAHQRHSKPQRSEYSKFYVDKFGQENSQVEIPEHIKLNQLHSHNDKLKYSEDSMPEEFVETDYYKDLNDLDKQHHTTGTGFIKVETTSDSDFHLGEVSDGFCKHTATNPATNEWIPCAEPALISSNKPNRSDSGQ